MNYAQTLNWLFNRLPMYQRVGSVAYKANLDNTIALADYLENPEKGFKSIHVAGTNGKGSTSHMLASVLQEAGYKVGLYTSPHLKDFRERIKINGNSISKRKVSSFVKRHKSFFEQNSLSFFEMTVGLAFDYFSKEKVDVAVIEVGMGGRLDSTNIIIPEVSIITNIGIDHTQFLGNSLAEIAGEKAGIIKYGTPVIIGETQEETKFVFEKTAKQKNAKILFADSLALDNYELDLKGSYQAKNLQTVLAALKVIRDKELFKITEKNIKNGLANTIKNTGLQGRWQVLQEKPKVICDTAHNVEGLRYVLEQLQEEKYKQLHLVLGFVADKGLENVLPLFPDNAKYYFCKPNIPRGLDVFVLCEKAKYYHLEGQGYSSVKAAFNTALKKANQDDIVFVGGSTFVVAEIV